ncbi:hypothetical protein EYF80_047461 [Liparis tanakae]|uniref:Uncharacterized protein n=1 Tax=Liparis tanakae TaxID=230148 RepID=A0A4Z2FM97_9TELE|nr:hypothetical protein EYF80_047461 [Liparis tanakae]
MQKTQTALSSLRVPGEDKSFVIIGHNAGDRQSRATFGLGGGTKTLRSSRGPEAFRAEGSPHLHLLNLLKSQLVASRPLPFHEDFLAAADLWEMSRCPRGRSNTPPGVNINFGKFVADKSVILKEKFGGVELIGFRRRPPADREISHRPDDSSSKVEIKRA